MPELIKTRFFTDTNLVSYWRMESNFNDSKGSNTGTAQGGATTTSTNAKFGQSSITNGSSQYISIVDDASLKPAGSFSLSVWVYVSSVAVNNCVFSTAYFDGTYNYGFWINIQFTSIARFTMGKGSTVGQANCDSISTISLNTWYHLVAVYDSTAQLQKIYLNGKLENSVARTSNANYSTSNYANIGVRNSNGTYVHYFNGMIDDLSLFSKALSSKEVMEIYEGKSAGEYLPNENTLGYWKLNGNSIDSSGHDNNGTDTNVTYSMSDSPANHGDSFFGKAAILDIMSTITIANETNFDFEYTSPFTISCWIKFSTTVGAGHNSIITKMDGQTGYEIRSFFDKTVFHIYFIRRSTADLYDFVGTTSSVSTNSWTYLTCTCTGGNGASTMKIYINGSEASVGSYSALASNSILNNSALLFGNNALYYSMIGSLDEVIIEDYAWSAQQVNKNYTERARRLVPLP